MEVSGKGKVLNKYGFWTGKHKFLCKMKENPEVFGEFIFPPARFKIGKVSGDLFFACMGIYCKNCKQYGHSEDNCVKKCCSRCLKEGHVYSECSQGKTCRICGQMGHLANSCPEKKKKEEGYVK